jgi:hypothetical protein
MKCAEFQLNLINDLCATNGKKISAFGRQGLIIYQDIYTCKRKFYPNHYTKKKTREQTSKEFVVSKDGINPYPTNVENKVSY